LSVKRWAFSVARFPTPAGIALGHRPGITFS
jgi:hypothetical protein